MSMVKPNWRISKYFPEVKPDITFPNRTWIWNVSNYLNKFKNFSKYISLSRISKFHKESTEKKD